MLGTAALPDTLQMSVQTAAKVTETILIMSVIMRVRGPFVAKVLGTGRSSGVMHRDYSMLGLGRFWLFIGGTQSIYLILHRQPSSASGSWAMGADSKGHAKDSVRACD